MSVARLLLVEDEQHIADGLIMNFELDGFSVDHAETARKADSLLTQRQYGCVVLDVMLPDDTGFALCRRMRDRNDYTPVIMLTARDSHSDRVTGLESGADDYLPKPFELQELLARIRSLLRRRDWDQQREVAPVLAFGSATVNFQTHEVQVGDEALTLTQLELDLLAYFAQREGLVVSRQELLERVWKLRNYPNTRTVDNFVMRLRKYFEPDPSNPTYFLSVRGAGYKFDPVPE